MQCEPTRLRDYIEGKLKRLEEEELERHCDVCEDCSELYATLLCEELHLLAPETDSIPDPQVTLAHFYSERQVSQRRTSSESILEKDGISSGLRSLWEKQRAGTLGWAFAIVGVVFFVGLRVFVPGSDTLTAKGIEFQMLHVHHQKGKGTTSFSKAEKTSNGARLHPFDAIQFRYQIPKRLEVMIVGINQQGKVYLLVSDKSKRASVSVKKGKGSFPDKEAFELDDYVGLERFFVLYRKKAFAFDEVRSTLKQAWKKVDRDLRKMKDLPEHWDCRTFLIQKVAGQKTK